MRTYSMPPQVHESISTYSAGAAGYDIPDLHDRAERVGSTLGIFTKKLLGTKAREAAGLLVFSDGLRSESTEAQAASWAVADYWTRPDYPVSEDERFYTAALLGDSERIDQSARRYEERLSGSSIGNEVLNAINRDDDVPISPAMWRHAIIGPDVPDLTEMISEVNVESSILKATMAMDAIARSKDNPRKQFAEVIAAETTHLSVLDALGLAAMKMALQSEIHKARLTGAGRKDLIEIGRTEIDRIKHINGQELVLEALFGKTPEQRTFLIADSTPYGSSIHFSEDDLAGLTDGERQGRVLARTKESLAWKLATNPSYSEERLPQDMVGLTAIVPDREQLAGLVASIIQTIHSSDCMEFATAASKKSPVYAQGRQEYLADLEGNIDPELFREIEVKVLDKPAEEAFQVVKITFDLIASGIKIPVEFQFQTEDDRENSRVGGANHNGYKLGDVTNGLPGIVPGDKHALRQIRESLQRLHGGDFANLVPVRRASMHAFIEAVQRNLM